MLDEVDKLNERIEDLFLQVLARGFYSVARLKPDSMLGFTPQYDDKFRFDAFPFDHCYFQQYARWSLISVPLPLQLLFYQISDARGND